MVIASIGLLGISCTKEDYSDDIVGNWDLISKEHFLNNRLISFSEDTGETWIFTEDGVFRRIASDGTHSTIYTITDNNLRAKAEGGDHMENYGTIKISDDILTITLQLNSGKIKEKFVTTLKRKPSGHHS
jgi:hypothetical protein